MEMKTKTQEPKPPKYSALTRKARGYTPNLTPKEMQDYQNELMEKNW